MNMMISELIKLFHILKTMMQHVLIVWVLEIFQKRLGNLKVIKMKKQTFSKYKEMFQ